MKRFFELKNKDGFALGSITVCESGSVHVHYGKSTFHFTKEEFNTFIQSASNVIELITHSADTIH